MMTCSGRDVYENHLGSTDQWGNWANSPWSCQPSNHALNCSRLTYANALNSFDPCPECIGPVFKISASDESRLPYHPDSFDGQMDERAACLSSSVISATTGAPVANGDTVDVTTDPNGIGTNADVENKIENATEGTGVVSQQSPGTTLGKQAPNTSEPYKASSRRSNYRGRTEAFAGMPGFRDSNIYSREAFLDTQEQQSKSNAVSLVIIAVCLVIFTIFAIGYYWSCGCLCGPKPVAKTLGGYSSYSLKGGSTNYSAPAFKSTPTTKLSGGHIF